MTIIVDISGLTNKLKASANLKSLAMKEALPVFIGYTPIRTGNARNNTDLRQDTIVANYPYAKRLNEGWSSQAPKGMVEPTKKEMVKIISDLISKGIK